MERNQLRAFLHRSREWSRATRGMELFEMSAADLQTYADADAGFFVYRKRILTDRLTAYRPEVYVPWGTFTEDIAHLQSLVEKMLPDLASLVPLMERWLSMTEFSEEVQTSWRKYQLSEIGIWPLISRERIMGLIVVAKTRAIRNRETLNLETRIALLDACAAQVSLAIDLMLAMRIAEESSQQDLLTGLLNRRGLNSKLPQHITSATEAGDYLLFGLVDLDNLKQVNDTLGHPAGDEALRQVADILRQQVGPNDLVARLGGDEFAIAIQSPLGGAIARMRRIQEIIEQKSDGLSVSVGGAVLGVDGDTLEECYQIADERLYDCKRLRWQKN